MRALVVTRYGGPEAVQLRDVPEPEPGPGDLRIEVHCTTVTSGDARIRAARFPMGMGALGRLALGLTGPRQGVLGVECAGRVLEVGPQARGFAVGDRVVALTGMRMRTHAEQCLVAADRCVARVPDGVPYEAAVALPFGGTTALSFLRRRAAVQPGERLLVIGAAGAVGAACVQVGKRLGAHVTGVCSGHNVELVRALGADEVVDRTRDRVTGTFDVVVETVGATPLRALRALLTPRGRLVPVAAGVPEMLAGPIVAVTSGQRIFTGVADESADDLHDLVAWHAAGEYQAVVDGEWPLSEAAAAHARVDSGHKRGSAVLRVR